MRVFNRSERDRAADVEAALYEGFLGDADRSRCQTLQRSLSGGSWQDLDYSDQRLLALAARLKARSFPELLSDGERIDWRTFVRAKLAAEESPWWNLARFRQRLAELTAEADDADPVLEALTAHAGRLELDYGL
jgi:exodeoxyribonuclease-1